MSPKLKAGSQARYRALEIAILSSHIFSSPGWLIAVSKAEEENVAIPVKYRDRFIYHFTHVENLENIIRSGFVAKNHPGFPKRVRSVAADSIQARRSSMPVPCGPGGVVHDYVPLYFGAMSPMLLGVIKAGEVEQRDILYFEFPINLVARSGVVFTDASANTNAAPNFFHDESDLDRLDWELIDSRAWGEPDDDKRHRRMAEILVYRQLPLAEASRCVVLDESVKAQLDRRLGGTPFPPVQLENSQRYHFYRKFWLDNSSL